MWFLPELILWHRSHRIGIFYSTHFSILFYHSCQQNLFLCSEQSGVIRHTLRGETTRQTLDHTPAYSRCCWLLARGVTVQDAHTQGYSLARQWEHSSQLSTWLEGYQSCSLTRSPKGSKAQPSVYEVYLVQDDHSAMHDSSARNDLAHRGRLSTGLHYIWIPPRHPHCFFNIYIYPSHSAVGNIPNIRRN